MKTIKHIGRTILLILGCLLYSLNASPATFNLFSPATGILKGSSSTYITSAAGSSDVIALWSGTCNASSFLRGDGACIATSTGTVTSVALTAPAIFTVSGSPVTTSGTLALTANGTSGGIPYFSASNALGSSGVLTASAITLGGGAGAAPTSLASLGTTVTLLHGNAAGAPTFAAVSLTADVTGVLPAANGGAIGANPTGTIGLVAVNGSATTYVRSDGAPALSQAIVPTWTGIHTWTLAEPRLLFNESDQASNKKVWDIDVQGGHFIGRTRTDADGAGKTWIDILRGTTTAISSLTLGNSSDTISYVFAGSGSVTIGGDANVSGNVMGGTFQSNGAQSISGCSLSAGVGSTGAGKFTSGTTGVCTVTITLPAVTNGWTCIGSDLTHPVAMLQTVTATNSCQMSATTTSGDVITYMTMAY